MAFSDRRQHWLNSNSAKTRKLIRDQWKLLIFNGGAAKWMWLQSLSVSHNDAQITPRQLLMASLFTCKSLRTGEWTRGTQGRNDSQVGDLTHFHRVNQSSSSPPPNGLPQLPKKEDMATLRGYTEMWSKRGSTLSISDKCDQIRLQKRKRFLKRQHAKKIDKTRPTGQQLRNVTNFLEII